MRTLLIIITTIIALSSCTSKSAQNSHLFAVLVKDSGTVIDMRLPKVYAVGDTISLLYIPTRLEYVIEQQHTANNTKGIIIR